MQQTWQVEHRGPLHFQTGELFETLQTSLGQVSEPSPLRLSPEVLLHTDAQTEAIDVWSAGMTLMELLAVCTTLRVDDQTGLSHVALVPSLEFRTLRWLKVSIAEMISGVRIDSNLGR